MHGLSEVLETIGGLVVTGGPPLLYIVRKLVKWSQKRDARMEAERIEFERWQRRMRESGGDPFGPQETPLDDSVELVRMRHLEETRRLRDQIERERRTSEQLRDQLKDAREVENDVARIQAALHKEREDRAILDGDGPYTLDDLRTYIAQLEDDVWHLSGFTKRPTMPIPKKASNPGLQPVRVLEIDATPSDPPEPFDPHNAPTPKPGKAPTS